MRIFEFEAKRIFSAMGIPVPRAGLAETPQQVYDISWELNSPVVLKPQTLNKGRGEAGLILFAQGPQEAVDQSRTLFGKEFEGEIIESILVEERVNVKAELYLGVTVDYSTALPVFITSPFGGIEIERTALERPELVTKTSVSNSRGVSEKDVKSIVKGFSDYLKEDWFVLEDKLKQMLFNLYRIFRTYECEMVEINPLGIKDDGSLVALDAAMAIDDDALFRHPEFVRPRGQSEEDFKKEQAFREKGWTYIQLDGDIGILSSGAGITMAILDLMSMKGGKPANFLDTAQMNRQGIYEAFKLSLIHI